MYLRTEEERREAKKVRSFWLFILIFFLGVLLGECEISNPKPPVVYTRDTHIGQPYLPDKTISF